MECKPFISVPTLKGAMLLGVKDIVYIYSELKTVTFYLENGQKVVCNIGIGQLENLLEQNCFFRCHNRYIVNIYQIDEIFAGCEKLLMKNTNTVPISRRNRPVFRKKMEEFCTKLHA